MLNDRLQAAHGSGKERCHLVRKAAGESDAALAATPDTDVTQGEVTELALPTTVESALVLVVLVAPGFIASRVKNALIAYRSPSAFQETVEALILSAMILPGWLAFGGYLLRTRDHFLGAWRSSTELPAAAIVGPALIVGLIYLVVAPIAGVAYAIIQVKRPHARLGMGVLRTLGGATRVGEGPEVWDQVFGRREVTPWVRVWFKDRSAVEGVITYAGVSPASRQLYLSGVSGVPNSLVRLDANGVVVENLSEKQGEGVWVEIGAEVQLFTRRSKMASRETLPDKWTGSESRRDRPSDGTPARGHSPHGIDRGVAPTRHQSHRSPYISR